MLDPRYQYVLCTISCKKQLLSDKSLSHSRKRCYDYESIYGVDLLHDCITGWSEKIAKMLDLNPRFKRRDSMMIVANIKKLSRAELLYICVVRLVVYLNKNNQATLQEAIEHYCDPNDYNWTVYYNNDSETDKQLKNILKEADKLMCVCSFGYDEVMEYRLLSCYFSKELR